MGNPDQITYTSAILDELNHIQKCKFEFDGLTGDMEKLRGQILAAWGQQSAAAFEAAHKKWTTDVTEIQQVLDHIIRAATDGHGEMAAAERAVANSFHP